MSTFCVVAVAALAGPGRVLISPVERRVAAARMFLVVLAAKSAAYVKAFRASVKSFLSFLPGFFQGPLAY